MLDYCYKNDKEKSKKIILLSTPQFNNMTCFEIAQNSFEIDKIIKEENKKFVAHECFQDTVHRVWLGGSYNMSLLVYFLYIFFAIFFGIFLFFPYIIFKVCLKVYVIEE